MTEKIKPEANQKIDYKELGPYGFDREIAFMGLVQGKDPRASLIEVYLPYSNTTLTGFFFGSDPKWEFLYIFDEHSHSLAVSYKDIELSENIKHIPPSSASYQSFLSKLYTGERPVKK